ITEKKIGALEQAKAWLLSYLRGEGEGVLVDLKTIYAEGMQYLEVSDRTIRSAKNALNTELQAEGKVIINKRTGPGQHAPEGWMLTREDERNVPGGGKLSDRSRRSVRRAARVTAGTYGRNGKEFFTESVPDDSPAPGERSERSERLEEPTHV